MRQKDWYSSGAFGAHAHPCCSPHEPVTLTRADFTGLLMGNRPLKRTSFSPRVTDYSSHYSNLTGVNTLSEVYRFSGGPDATFTETSVNGIGITSTRHDNYYYH
jgi:hypothetical protein